MTPIEKVKRGPWNVGDDVPPRPTVPKSVEAVARALVVVHYKKMGAQNPADLAMLAEKWWPDFVEEARAAIDALADVVDGKAPTTTAMADAFWKRFDPERNPRGYYERFNSGFIAAIRSAKGEQ